MNNKYQVLTQAHTNIEKLVDSKIQAMPKGFNKTRFIQNAMTVLQDTKGIENCSPLSIARTVLKGAFLGLDFFSKECYAIPYGNELQFQTDYKGEKKLIKKYSIRPILDIYAKVIRKGDEFAEIITDGKPSLNFKPLPLNNNEIIGAFAVALYKDGGMEYEVMTAEEIEDIRNNFSKQKNSLMWTKTPGEAYKKTVLRRLTKQIEKDFETIEMAKEFDKASDFEFNEEIEEPKNPFVEVEYEEAEEKENAETDKDNE
jgi:recombination protein RecT